MKILMRGARPLRKNLIQFIGANLGKYLDLAESQWNVTKIIRPNRVEAYEAVSFQHEDRCIMAVSIVQSENHVTNGLDMFGAREYSPEYDVQLYTWCLEGYDDSGETIADSRVQTLAQRDDIATVIRSMLLDNPALGSENDEYELIEGSLIEEYSLGEATPNSSGRYIAGVVHNFTIRVEETLVRFTDDYANAFEVDADKLLEEQGGQP